MRWELVNEFVERYSRIEYFYKIVLEDQAQPYFIPEWFDLKSYGHTFYVSQDPYQDNGPLSAWHVGNILAESGGQVVRFPRFSYGHEYFHAEEVRHSGGSYEHILRRARLASGEGDEEFRRAVSARIEAIHREWRGSTPQEEFVANIVEEAEVATAILRVLGWQYRFHTNSAPFDP